MKKIVLSLIVCSNIVFANDINTCGVFANVLQTRDNPSKIEMQGDANIYDSLNCNLNTGEIEQGEWDKILFCGNGPQRATATGQYGDSLNDSEIFSWEFVDSGASNSVGGGSSTTITSQNEILTNNKYKVITQNRHNYSFTWSPSGSDIAVKEFDNILNNVTIDNIENKDEIGLLISAIN
jgi:hypothetical protein